MDWEFASATDAGRIRGKNEDTVLARGDLGLFAVADGMGGHAAGEVASRLAVETLLEWIEQAGPADLGGAFEAANRAILARADADPDTRGMGTTLSVLLLRAPDRALVAHVGDSRLYRWRSGRLLRVTRDHTWVQDHLDAGILSADQARSHPFASVLTRVLGTPEPAVPDLATLPVIPGDLFVLCSDGLTGMIEDPDIARVLAEREDLAAIAGDLVEAANRNGGADNISVVVVRAGGG